LFARNTESLIVSSYRDWISKLRADVSLEEFKAALDKAALDWSTVTSPWEVRFGDAFEVRKFETIQEGQEEFLKDFAAWARLPLKAQARLDVSNSLNRSFGPRQVELARAMIPFLKEDEREKARRFLLRLGPN
jgi:hypothetical protein